MLRDNFNPFEISNNTFLVDFRLNKITVMDIIQRLEPFVPLPTTSDAIISDNIFTYLALLDAIVHNISLTFT